MSQNLWQIVNYDDLLHFLRKGKNKYTVLAIVLLKGEDNIKKIIKKFIKEKSKLYPHITFLYYVVRNEDFGRASFVTNKTQEYPKLCHIYNITEMLIEVKSIDCVEAMELSFEQLEDYYNDCEKEARNVDNNDNNNDDNNGNNDNNDNNDNDNNVNQKNVSTKNNKSTNVSIGNVGMQGADIIRTDPVTERKKQLEKLTLIQDKWNEYTIEFLKDCQKRKKEEEKQKSKSKK